jgi:hypothetical protein
MNRPLPGDPLFYLERLSGLCLVEGTFAAEASDPTSGVWFIRAKNPTHEFDVTPVDRRLVVAATPGHRDLLRALVSVENRRRLQEDDDRMARVSAALSAFD